MGDCVGSIFGFQSECWSMWSGSSGDMAAIIFSISIPSGSLSPAVSIMFSSARKCADSGTLPPLAGSTFL